MLPTGMRNRYLQFTTFVAFCYRVSHLGNTVLGFFFRRRIAFRKEQDGV
jgi:hypothetical protein